MVFRRILTKINYFNADHTHALIDLSTRYSIEEVIKLFKGGSSYWINHSQIIKGKFAWGGGYGAFSVSHSDVHGLLATSPTRKNIIASGRMWKNTSCLLSGMVWKGALRKTIEMVAGQCRCRFSPLKVGEKEMVDAFFRA